MPNEPITHGEMKQMMDIVSKNAEHSESIANSLRELAGSMVILASIKRDIEIAKWFIGIVGLATVVATVVLRGLDNRALFRTEVKQVVQELVTEKAVQQK